MTCNEYIFYLLTTVFIYCTPILTLIYVYYNWWIWYSYLYNTVFSWTGTNIHGLDRHRRYIYLYLKLWFSRKRRKLLQQNRAWMTGCSCIYFLSIRFSNCSDVVVLYYFLFYYFLSTKICFLWNTDIRRVWRYQREVIRIRISKKNRNTMAKRKATNGQTAIYKTYT